jgi:putative pyruvate formate lyase activating enzyme
MSNFPRYRSALESGGLDESIKRAYRLAENCQLCPRRCGVKRLEGETGVCQAKNSLRISSFIRHRGEEPVLSGSNGSGTVFFSHCGFRCKFCQNWQISFEGEGRDTSVEQFARGMLALQRSGVHNINWVTPSHYLPWLLSGLKIAADQGLTIPLVYNCSGYESLDALELLDGVVDIFLPDAKYADSELASALSSAQDYPEVNRAALAEMFRQVGDLETDGKGIARKGLIVRHLIIPGESQNTRMVLDMLKKTIGTSVAISLMGQYFPTERVQNTQYDRTLTPSEYQEAADYMFSLGFENGWVQEELGVVELHRPDFRKEKKEMY